MFDIEQKQKIAILKFLIPLVFFTTIYMNIASFKENIVTRSDVPEKIIAMVGEFLNDEISKKQFCEANKDIINGILNYTADELYSSLHTIKNNIWIDKGFDVEVMQLSNNKNYVKLEVLVFDYEKDSYRLVIDYDKEKL